MSKTSAIQMMKFIEDMAELLIEQDGLFTSAQLAGYVNTRFGILPGDDWLSTQLSKEYHLIDGLWHRQP